jgi:hypothetical protein
LLTNAAITAESALLATPNNVPEHSATVMLMGVALLGLAGLKRKFRA